MAKNCHSVFDFALIFCGGGIPCRDTGVEEGFQPLLLPPPPPRMLPADGCAAFLRRLLLLLLLLLPSSFGNGGRTALTRTSTELAEGRFNGVLPLLFFAPELLLPVAVIWVRGFDKSVGNDKIGDVALALLPAGDSVARALLEGAAAGGDAADGAAAADLAAAFFTASAFARASAFAAARAAFLASFAA